MMILILPFVVVSMTTSSAPEARAEVDEMVVSTSPRAAQVRLADALGAADSIDSVHAKGSTVTFAITRGDRRIDLVATTQQGRVVQIVERDRGISADELGSLSWLVDTMQSTVAVTHLSVDEDGAVMLTTDQGQRYMAIPGRGSGGNASVEARWAAEWNQG